MQMGVGEAHSSRMPMLSPPETLHRMWTSQAHSSSLSYSANRAGSSATSFALSPSNRILVTRTLSWAQSPSLIVVLDFLLFTL